mmetsp:Transcript_14740/g.29464  ORF Transcript_14740/g.29464 Transcript_14740/m.29464 type:complete len:228 (-) Transcript_14740:127-810(-)
MRIFSSVMALGLCSLGASEVSVVDPLTDNEIKTASDVLLLAKDKFRVLKKSKVGKKAKKRIQELSVHDLYDTDLGMKCLIDDLNKNSIFPGHDSVIQALPRPRPNCDLDEIRYALHLTDMCVLSCPTGSGRYRCESDCIRGSNMAAMEFQPKRTPAEIISVNREPDNCPLHCGLSCLIRYYPPTLLCFLTNDLYCNEGVYTEDSSEYNRSCWAVIIKWGCTTWYNML